MKRRAFDETFRQMARASPMADKHIKTLLHLSAMTAIRAKGELRDYYQRKVAEGKNNGAAVRFQQVTCFTAQSLANGGTAHAALTPEFPCEPKASKNRAGPDRDGGPFRA